MALLLVCERQSRIIMPKMLGCRFQIKQGALRAAECRTDHSHQQSTAPPHR